MKPKTWNDVLAITFGLVILSIWTLAGTRLIELPDIVLGATISIFTLIAQFYFRKAKSES